MKIQKGTYGYLKRKRNQTILIVAVFAALILATYLIPLSVFKTNQNVFTIAAALLCLPEARFIVNLVMLCRARGCTSRSYDEICGVLPDTVPCSFDLYLTSYQKNFQISAIAVRGKSVIALTEDPSCDLKAGEQHIRRLMQQNNFHAYTVKIFDSVDSFTRRLSQFADIPETESRETIEELMHLFQNISL